MQERCLSLIAGILTSVVPLTVGAAAVFTAPSPSSVQSSTSPEVQQITLRVQGPARIGFPIWLYADLRGGLVARYPFGSDLRYIGSNRLELQRDGQALTIQHPTSGVGGLIGLIAGSIAPPSSPQNRLPLHLAFKIDRPGRYSVRWTVTGENVGRAAQSGTPERVLAQSGWLEFDVVAATPAEREAWLAATLAARPTDPGLYIGDYLPSLLAALPNRRVAQAVIDGTYSDVELIRSCTLSALEMFPSNVSAPLVLESLRQRGPNVGLAYFVSWHAAWFQDRRDEIVRTAVSFLRSSDDVVAEGALEILGFARHFDWKGDTTALRNADNAVERSASALAARSGPVAHALAAYSPSVGNAATRDRLWQQVERRGPEREQALIALTWIADPADLSKLGNLLIQAGNPDPRGTDLASLAYHLMRAYGEQSIPYLQRALAESPYVWVRTQSAEQLALKGKEEAFRFFLDAVVSNRSYRAELVSWLRVTFRLPTAADDSAVTAFLNERIRDPKGPPAQEFGAEAAVLRLKSRDAATRKAAAQELINLAQQSPQNLGNVGAFLTENVIRKPEQVSTDTWRDAALVLGRLHNALTPVLTLYLEREGATAALIETGEPAISAVADVLYTAAPPRRRLAAEVLGAIGSAAALDALTTALKTESDAGVRQAIQRALSRLGRRPPPAEIR